jgi:hypothetical protein
VFALGYALTFALLGEATWWGGALLGVLHAFVAFAVIVPLLPGAHPRMASHRTGPGTTVVLEPPGLFALSYGVQTPLVAAVAHVGFGALLGALLGAR